jgi:antitoxin (DNA-binding transcriptional repressor) of toxin-antitoxin stability system
MNVNISELKARLCAYLHKVRRGETLTVLDRKTPVARIVPHAEERADLVLHPARRAFREISKVRGVGIKRTVDVARILEETRGDR